MAHERRLHHPRLQQPAADLDLAALAGGGRHPRQGDGAAQGGRETAAGDLALADARNDDLLVVAQHAPVLQHQAHQLARHAFGALPLQRRPADEIAVLRFPADGPVEAGFQRCHVLVHVGAVQGHARLQAQRIACAQAAGPDAGSLQAAPQGHGGIAGQHDLETVLAGVAGAGDEPVVQRRREERRQQGGPFAVVRVQQAEHALARLRPLHRDHGQFRPLGHAHGERLRLAADPGQVLVAGGGIDHQAEEIVPEEVDDEIVDDAAALVEHAAVQGLAGVLQLVDVVGHQQAQEVAAARAFEIDHRHVGHVEHAGAAAHRVVLLDLGAVVDRHVPAGEVDHLRALAQMLVVEGSLLAHGYPLSGDGGNRSLR